jgi:hypothetical protein
MRPFLIAAIAAFIPVFASGAEAVDLMSNDYIPLIERSAGRVVLCGTDFSTVLDTGEKVLSIHGVVFSTWHEGRAPGLAIQTTVSEVINRKLDMAKKRVRSFAFRVDAQDTRSLRAVRETDGKTLVLLTDASRSDLVFTFPKLFRKGAWLSLSLDGEPADVTFRLPAFGQADRDTVEQVDRCNEEGLDTVKREMKARGLLSEGDTGSTRDDAARPQQWR